MPAGEGVDLPEMLTVVMDAIVGHYAASDLRLPDRRIIAPGDVRGVPWDCEQLVVASAGLVWSPASGFASTSTTRATGNPTAVMQVRFATLVVQVVRCIPTGEVNEPPPARDVTAAGLRAARDAALLSQALVEVCGRNGPLKDYGAAQPGDVLQLADGEFAAVEGSLSVTAGKLR